MASPAAIGQPLGNRLPRADVVKVDGPQPVEVTGPIARPRITLTLGGGGCKSIADIGVLRAFERNHIPIDFIVGTSAGATIGALYASGVSVDEIEKLVVTGELQHVMVPSIIPRLVFSPLWKLFRIFQPPHYAGITNGHRLVKFLHKHLPDSFAETKIPFAAVATDLESGDTVMITSGDLCQSVLASAALPPLVRPVELNGRLFADGGIKDNLPANCAKLTKADLIVSVLSDAPIRHIDKQEFTKLNALVTRVTDIMEAAIDKQHLQDTDVLIFPAVADTPMMTKDPNIVKRTIAAGDAAATKLVPAIKKKAHIDGNSLPLKRD
jgi:NTE family protein